MRRTGTSAATRWECDNASASRPPCSETRRSSSSTSPGNGLDPQGIRWLRDLLRERAVAGGTVFVSSHLLAEVEHLADEIVVMNHGRLVATRHPVGPAAGWHLGPHPRHRSLTQLLREVGATVHTGSEGELVVRGVGIAEIGDRACRAGIALHQLSPQAGSLEELFLGWTKDDNTATSGAATAHVATEPERQAVPL